ncbi:MAG: prolyl oligopeptidase family serine peptidase [Pseudomonadota bacterium]
MSRFFLVLTSLILGSTLMSACTREAATSSASSSASNEAAPETADGRLAYPATRRGDAVDTYFGTRVSDPYRWLEDDRSEETAKWVAAQNALTRSYLDAIPFRDTIAATVEELLDYERESAPFFEGDYQYYYANDGLQNQDVLYRRSLGADTAAEIFLDPNSFSDDGTVSMSAVSFSRDGRYVAYQLSEGGSDWRSIVTLATDTLEPVGDALSDVKFSGIAWRGSEGFYYSSYDKPDGSELSAMTDQHKLYFHRLGSPQAEDELIFGADESEKYRYVGASVTEDDRFLSISAADSTSGERLFIVDLAAKDPRRVVVVDDQTSDVSMIESDGDWIYLKTNRDAPNGRVVRVRANDPVPGNWEDVIPERDAVLSVSTGGDFFFAIYMVDALSRVEQIARDGSKVREIELPDLGTAYGFNGKRWQDTLYFSFTNYRLPSSIFSVDVASGDVDLYRASRSVFDSDAFETEQVFYSSRDGTRVPMTITYARGTPRDGSAPTMLYGYGGFNISLRPGFSSGVGAWLKLGGVYAVPNLRGGGEYGKEWHLAGTKQSKQNVFDDFIAAAEYLITEGYTSRERLVLRGGSNGGLLVGAVMTQRPDLFGVALPAVGVMDMLRYHRFTSGAGWAYDYGTADDGEAMFRYIYGYSPLHQLKDGTAYPATLVTTADHDDRVVPAHSFKFAARLQQAQKGSAPVLIRIETDAGHGAGTPTSKIIDQYADVFSFALNAMGIETLATASLEVEGN